MYSEDIAIENFIDFCDYMQIDDYEIADEMLLGTAIGIGSAVGAAIGIGLGTLIVKVINGRGKKTISPLIENYDKIKYVSYDERIIPIVKKLIAEYKKIDNKGISIWKSKAYDKKYYKENPQDLEKITNELNGLKEQVKTINNRYLPKVLEIKKNPQWTNSGNKELIKPIIDQMYTLFNWSFDDPDKNYKVDGRIIKMYYKIYDEMVSTETFVTALNMIKVQYNGKEKMMK